MELPRPLIISLHKNYAQEYRGYIERRGGKWEWRSRGKDTITLPEGTALEQVDRIRANHEQARICFLDGGYFVWHRIRKNERHKNNDAIFIPGGGFERVNEEHPPIIIYFGSLS